MGIEDGVIIGPDIRYSVPTVVDAIQNQYGYCDLDTATPHPIFV